jgi:hypothetical protein
MNLHDLLFKPAALSAGETKLINGATALCINPTAYRGAQWAITGRCTLFTTHEHNSRYMKGLCRNVSPGNGFVTIEIIKGPYPAGTMLNITLDEFARYEDVSEEDDAYLKKVLNEATGTGRRSPE